MSANFTNSTGWYSIYALIDPRDNSICYCGISRNPEVRLKQHMSGDTALHLISVVEAIKQLNLRLVTRILDSRPETHYSFSEAAKLETQWIRHLEALGHPLRNAASVSRARALKRKA